MALTSNSIEAYYKGKAFIKGTTFELIQPIEHTWLIFIIYIVVVVVVVIFHLKHSLKFNFPSF